LSAPGQYHVCFRRHCSIKASVANFEQVEHLYFFLYYLLSFCLCYLSCLTFFLKVHFLLTFLLGRVFLLLFLILPGDQYHCFLILLLFSKVIHFLNLV